MRNRRSVMIWGGACGAASLLPSLAIAQQASSMPVVASFSILGDMTRQIGGDRVSVTELIGPDQDAHGYQPSPADVRRLAAAKVLVANGLDFEPWLYRLLKTANASARRIIVTDAIKPLAKPTATKEHGHDHAHGKNDPHAWQSVANARQFATAIAGGLTAADPTGKAEYEVRLTTYLAALDTLAKDIETIIATIPVDRRLLVTTHNAFRYFANEFGLKSEALQGISAENEPSAADMAKIIRQLKAMKAPAVFLENITDPRKIEQIARESGAKIGGTLYSDALSLANGPAPTYIDMMRHNVRQIAQALK